MSANLHLLLPASLARHGRPMFRIVHVVFQIHVVETFHCVMAAPVVCSMCRVQSVGVVIAKADVTTAIT